MTVRSYLFVPADAGQMLAKAWTRGADAIIIDLEDAVAPVAKPVALEGVWAWIDAQADPPGEIWVRVNNVPELLDAELERLAGAALTGFVIPKSRDGAHVEEIIDKVTRAAPDSSPGLIVMIETAGALLEVAAIAATGGVTALMLGEYDLAANLGMDPDPMGSELLSARNAVVVASAAAGIRPPIGAGAANFRDLDGFRATTLLLARLGFLGRATIHPSQVEIVNGIFTPTSEEVAAAARTLELFDRAMAAGQGIFADDDGNILDEALVLSARRTMATARAAGLL